MGLGQSIARKVDEATRELLARDGFDLVLVEYIAHGNILRLYIDHAEGVSLDHCSQVSRLLGDVLDAEGILEGPGGIAGQYTLEVSSPGLDRPLVRPEHFQRFVGKTVQIVTQGPVQGLRRHKFTGELKSADHATVSVETDGDLVHLDYAQIERAKLVPQF